MLTLLVWGPCPGTEMFGDVPVKRVISFSFCNVLYLNIPAAPRPHPHPPLSPDCSLLSPRGLSLALAGGSPLHSPLGHQPVMKLQCRAGENCLRYAEWVYKSVTKVKQILSTPFLSRQNRNSVSVAGRGWVTGLCWLHHTPPGWPSWGLVAPAAGTEFAHSGKSGILLECTYAWEYWIRDAAAVPHSVKPASPVFLMSKPRVEGPLPRQSR